MIDVMVPKEEEEV